MSRNCFFGLVVLWCFLGLSCKISGTVSCDGVGIAGTRVVLQGDAETETHTDKNGAYSFNRLGAGVYTVTLSPFPGWSASVSKRVVKDSDYTNVTGIDFTMSSSSLRRTATGEVIGFSADNGSHVWLGIPYAQAPLGALRWKEPRTHKAWSGIWPALALGSPCTQFADLLSDEPEDRYGQPTGCED